MESLRNLGDFNTDVRSSFGIPDEVLDRIVRAPHISFTLEDGREVSILIGRKVEPEDPQWSVWVRHKGKNGHHFGSTIGIRLEDALKGLGVDLARRAVTELQAREGTV